MFKNLTIKSSTGSDRELHMYTDTDSTVCVVVRHRGNKEGVVNISHTDAEALGEELSRLSNPTPTPTFQVIR